MPSSAVSNARLASACSRSSVVEEVGSSVGLVGAESSARTWSRRTSRSRTGPVTAPSSLSGPSDCRHADRGSFASPGERRACAGQPRGAGADSPGPHRAGCLDRGQAVSRAAPRSSRATGSCRDPCSKEAMARGVSGGHPLDQMCDRLRRREAAIAGFPGFDPLASRQRQPPDCAHLSRQARERDADPLEVAVDGVVVVQDRELTLGLQPVLVGPAGLRPRESSNARRRTLSARTCSMSCP